MTQVCRKLTSSSPATFMFENHGLDWLNQSR
uniref:Uncharacterized protein n=1 Tax=Rhizophora mucronata TaxID=61149 RepID=A0A2P2QIK1_RHIMU